MKKVFVIYQHAHNKKMVFGYTPDQELVISELIRLSDYSAENKFSLEYNFIPFDAVLLKTGEKQP